MPRRLARGAGAALPLTAALALAGAVPARAQVPDLSTLRGPRVTVHYAQRDSGRAARTLRILEAQPPLPALPPDVPDPVHVWLAPDEAAFQELAGGSVPEWGAGVAIPSLQALVMPAYVSPRSWIGSEAGVLRHEWAHLGLHAHLDGLRIPRWFDEGYAEWASGGFDATEAWRLRILLATGRLPPLDSLGLDWPRDRASASAAYLLSASAVVYLLENGGGERGMALFLDRWREDGSFEAALRRTYGVTSGQLEEDWRKWVKDRYGWLLVLSHSLAFWALLALALMLMALVRRRRNRAHMARLRAGDPPEMPAWWEEEGGERREP